jgi:hypothetical protein
LSAKRAQGQIPEKPKGTLQKSKFDQNLEKIKELLGYQDSDGWGLLWDTSAR